MHQSSEESFDLSIRVTRPDSFLALCVVCTLAAAAIADDAAKFTNVSQAIRGEFKRCDRNDDQRLTLQEFSQRSGEPSVLKRDFELFDLDGDDFLTRTEFASVSGLTQPSLRGPIPDPFDDLAADAVAALDQSYEHWNQRPDELINAHIFVANFIGSISHGGKRYVTGRILRHADRNADGRLSRTEAKRFLQYQLGIIYRQGPPLRESTGRLVRFNRFIEMDQNQDDALSEQEFLSGCQDNDSAQQDFVSNDRDQNGSITYAEYANHARHNFFDPIEWFRAADTSLDARLDRDELAAAVDPSRHHLVLSTLAAFDDDDDKLLSLQEYRLSMLGNVNYPWEVRPVDVNRDGRLSYDEFVFHKADLFQLQRRFYFHRLDRNGDGSLSTDEFEFKSQPPLSIHRRSIDSDQSKLVYRSDDFPQCGWPCVSPDGTRILFHRTPAFGSRGETRIVVMNVDGKNVRDLCDGSNPSWSADGLQFVCARRTEQGLGVWIMDADGQSGLRVADGDSPKWSPDGSTIAYQRDNGVWLYDIERGSHREIFSRQDHRYQDLGDDVAWSPSSEQVAVVGNHGESSHLIVLSVLRNNGDAGVVTGPAFSAARPSNLNWIAGAGIVIGVRAADWSRLVALSPTGNTMLPKLQPFAAEPGWNSACITPNGKWYIAVSDR